MSKKLSAISLAFLGLLSSCSYSITMVHTQGEATDVVDETTSNTPTTSVSVPASGV